MIERIERFLKKDNLRWFVNLFQFSRRRPLIMANLLNPQDVVRCKLCENPNPELYCALCHIDLCKTCAGEHLLDESKIHTVIPIKHRRSTFHYPTCPKHSTKQNSTVKNVTFQFVHGVYIRKNILNTRPKI